MIKVAVAGAAGRMGKLIVQNVVGDAETQLVQAFDLHETGKDAGEVAGTGKVYVEISHASEMKDKLNADVLIDFTNANAAIENIKTAAEKGIALIVGTTGFTEEQKKEIDRYCRNVPAVVSPNFSIGVNVFWKVIEFATGYLAGYDIE
ncbi:MAG TPA: 4-hydroxy-tetrahydrodipicolinate reductase, partial [Archaeoglobaceae archaeon]|nr:4-hydroxy-tetrahydrodipicolinate reductase [Archaeoglobaceae archaeon]